MNQLTNSYNVFSKRIDEISEYINMTMQQSAVLSSFKSLILTENQQSVINYYKTLNGLTIQYNAIIISLYGCFENFIDDIVGRYIEIVFEKTLNYKDLPDKIKNKYKNRLGSFLSEPQRFINMNLEETTVVQNYTKILSSDFSAINKQFLLYHSGNLKIEHITTLFSEVGISNFKDHILSSSQFVQYHILTEGVEPSVYDTKRARNHGDLFSRLDELIEQRNNVSHGWYAGSRIGHHDLTTYTIPFLKTISEIILRICLVESAKFSDDSDYMFGNGISISVPKKSVLCINTNGNNINNGDFIIYRTDDKRDYFCAKVKQLQENNDAIDATGTIPKNVGIELDNKILKEHVVMFLIKSS